MSEQPPLPPIDNKLTESVRSGQRFLILGIAANIGCFVLNHMARATKDPFFLGVSGLIGLFAIIISVLGMLRVGKGLRFHVASRIGLCVLLFVPLISLITLLIVNGKATRHLRATGYTVGLLGAKKQKLNNTIL